MKRTAGGLLVLALTLASCGTAADAAAARPPRPCVKALDTADEVISLQIDVNTLMLDWFDTEAESAAERRIEDDIDDALAELDRLFRRFDRLAARCRYGD